MPDIDTRNVVTVTDRASLDNTVAVMDLGAVAFNPRGEYSPGETYSLLDLVQWNGKGWICKSVAGTQVEPSEGAADEWMLWANNGSEGLLEAAVAAKEAAEAAQKLAQANQTASETAKTQAETAAGTATTKAEEAAESAQNAEKSKQDAATQANNAQASAEAAQGSADDASNSADTANTAAETATSKAEEAAGSALEASQSADAANTAASTATTKAQEAADSAAEAKSAADAAATEAAEKAAKEAAQAAATEAAEKAAQGIEDHPPKINDSGTWEVYNPSEQAYTDTGKQSRGENGKDATVNGENAVTIQGGDNLTVDTAEGTITLDFNSKGTVASDIAQTKKDTAEIITILHRKPDLFGYKRIAADSNPESRIIYTHEAVGMTPARMGSAIFSRGDWGDVWFVKDNYPCMLNPNGTEAYRLNPNDYGVREDTGAASGITDIAGNLNAMSAIPTIWVKRYMDGEDEQIIFCKEKYDDSFHAYAHTDSTGRIKANAYHAIYKGCIDSASKLRSVSGQRPWQTTGGFDAERTAVKKNGENWEIRTWSLQMLIMDMCTMISKHDNSQTAFGMGNTTSGAAAQHELETGTMNTKGQFWGDLVGTTSGVKVFHMENFWGDRWDRLAGLIQQGGVWLAKMTPENGGYNATGVGYEAFPVGLGSVAASGNGGQHATYSCRLGTVPIAPFNGSATTYNGTWFWWNTEITAIGLAGGSCHDGARDGSRCLHAYDTAGGSYWYLGGSPSLV